MGLFNKLFGNDAAKTLDSIKDAAQKLANEAEKTFGEAGEELKKAAEKVDIGSGSGSDGYNYSAPAPQTDSVWDTVPAEENQYNYSGNYIQYFEHIFREDFPEYAFTKTSEMNGSSSVFTLTSAGRKVLIIELKSESSESQKVKKAAAREGVPYLRFYYNHQGWWNTRSYVTDRIRKAL